MEPVFTAFARAGSLLVGGETGTGKTAFVGALHAISPWSNRPLCVVDCSAMQENSLHKMLLGYEPNQPPLSPENIILKMDRTGAGILFLDHVDQMSEEIQQRLLPVVEKMASSAPECGVMKTKVICATSINLSAAVSRGEFSEDLYRFFGRVEVFLQPLRDRKDIMLLVDKILKIHCGGRSEITLTPLAVRAIRQHPWPGNLRQLVNLLKTACALLEPDGVVIDTDHFSGDF
ncbi:sigma 54-interacting transcriptional regulator [Paraburkholderia caffeinilytica]|nr:MULTISPECIES: sigma 54-interacting transcriptional regulator [Paraburkholderia]